jgi:predicted alpha/beta superfamily hydrolase
MRHASIACALLALGTLPSVARAAPQEVGPAAAPPPRPLVMGRELLDLDLRMESAVIESKRLGARLRIDVSWLAGTEEDRGRPAVYLTDGHWRRADHKYVHTLTARGQLPPAVVVGIGYPEGTDVQQARTRDLYDAPAPLLAAILEEVIPWVERRHRCDPARRVLFGASLGGHFSLYALRRSALDGRHPFLGYIGASSWDPGAALALDALEGREVPAQLYLTYGGREGASGEDRISGPNAALFRALDGAAPPGLRVVHHVNPDADHYTNTRATLVDGVRLLLGDERARGIGFVDLSLASAHYDFHAPVQVFDWEPQAALREVARAGDGAPALPGARGSLRVVADFTIERSGRLATTFDHFEDLARREVAVHLFVPGELARLGYRARIFVLSTYGWKQDLGAPVPLDRTGWIRVAHRWNAEATAGDPGLVRSVGVVIERPEGAPAWKGVLHVGDVGW